MQVHMELYPEQNLFSNKNRVNLFDKVVGTDNIQKKLLSGMQVDDIAKSWSPELETFKVIREKYLLYK